MQYRGFSRVIVLAALLLIPTPGFTAAKEIPLKASSNWLVDWSEHSCSLARKFGTAESPVLLSMRAYQPGYNVEITIAGKEVYAFQKAKVLTISYGAGEPIQIPRYQSGTSDGYGPAVIFGTVMESQEKGNLVDDEDDRRPFPDAAFEAQLDRITLSTTHRKVTLGTGPMAKALDKLRECTDNLVKGWGLDPAAQAHLTRKVKAENLGEWARQIQASFPSELIMQNKEARVNVVVIVDEEGKPADCDSWQAFANTEFKQKVCEIIRKTARFNPALDQDSRPIKSYYKTVVLYRTRG